MQVVAIAMAGELRVDQLARIPLYFPTYAGILVRTAYRAAKQIYRSSAASSSMPSEGLHRLFTWADMLLGRRPAESLPHAKKNLRSSVWIVLSILLVYARMVLPKMVPSLCIAGKDRPEKTIRVDFLSGWVFSDCERR